MDFFINLYAKTSGIWANISDLLPLLGALGGILGALSTIGTRAAGAKSAAELITALHPTPQEAGAIAIGVGLIKQHFKHQSLAESKTQTAS